MTFTSPNWRKSHVFTIPKRSPSQNCQVDGIQRNPLWLPGLLTFKYTEAQPAFFMKDFTSSVVGVDPSDTRLPNDFLIRLGEIQTVQYFEIPAVFFMTRAVLQIGSYTAIYIYMYINIGIHAKKDIIWIFHGHVVQHENLNQLTDTPKSHLQNLYTLPKTNSSHLKIGRAPKGNDRIPTIHFQV